MLVGILTSVPVPSEQADSIGATDRRNLPGRVQGRRGPDDPPGVHRDPETRVHGRQAAEHHQPRRRRRSTPASCRTRARVLFSSNRDGRQRDIYRYDITTKAVRRVTTTPEDERSPKMTPDGTDVQRGSWCAAAALAVEPGRFRCRIPPRCMSGPFGTTSGCHPRRLPQWVPDGQGAGTLALVDLESGSSEVVASNVGPSLQLRPRAGSVDLRVQLTRRAFADQGARSRDAEGRHLRADRRWWRSAGVDAQRPAAHGVGREAVRP